MNQHVSNPFANDAAFADMIDKIEGFNHTSATPQEQVKLTTALKLLSLETIRRHREVQKIERELRERIAFSDVVRGMKEVLDVEVPSKKRGFWTRLWHALPFSCGNFDE